MQQTEERMLRLHDAAPVTSTNNAALDTSTLLLDSTGSSSERGLNFYGSTVAANQRQYQHVQDDSFSSSSGSKNFGSLFWIIVLIVSHASERCTFKFMVDRYGPFRLFAAEAVTGTYTLLLGIQMLFFLRQGTDSSSMASSLSFSTIFQLPPLDLGLIVLLDSLQILLAYICGSHVLPVLTVTLTQFTIPLVLFFTQLAHKHGSCNVLYSYSLISTSENGEASTANGSAAVAGVAENDEQGNVNRNSATTRGASDEINNNCNTASTNGIPVSSPPSCGGYTAQHIAGAVIILIALILGLTPSMLCIENYSSSFVQQEESVYNLMVQRAWNTMLYSLSFIPASISQLLKEHMLTTYRQPVETVQLNFTLSAFKLFTLGVLAPFFYPLQGLHSGVASPYPSRDLSSNFQDAALCTLGLLSDESSQHRYAEPASCGIFSWLWIVGHVSSTIALTFSVQKVVMLNSSTSTSASGEQLQQQQLIVYQSLIIGLVVASLLMWLYTLWSNEVEEPWKIGEFNLVNLLHVSSFLLVIFGLELYHRNTIPGLTFETVYPEVEYYTAEEE